MTEEKKNAPCLHIIVVNKINTHMHIQKAITTVCLNGNDLLCIRHKVSDSTCCEEK